MTRCQGETMPQCHVQVKTPNLFQRRAAAKQERSCQFLWNSCWQLQQHGSNKAGYFCQFCWRTLAAHRRKAKIVNFVSFWWSLAEVGGKVKAVRRCCWPGRPRSYPGSARPRVLPVLHRSLSPGLLFPRKWKMLRKHLENFNILGQLCWEACYTDPYF